MSDTQRKLLNSLEIKCLTRDGLLYTVLLLVIILITSCNRGLSGSDSALVAAITLGICLPPFWVFYLWRVICIFRKTEHYIFCRAKLNQPHQHFFLRAMSFSVAAEAPDGRTFYVDTHAIFQTHGFIGPLLEDYVNSTVTIAYNEETGMVVVIG